MTRKQSQFNLEPIAPSEINRRSRGVRITIDSDGRMTLSAEYRKMLGIMGVPQHLYIAVDPASKIIAIVRQDVTRSVPNAGSIRITHRGEVKVAAVAAKLALSGKGRHIFEYIGKIDHDGVSWDGFRMIDNSVE